MATLPQTLLARFRAHWPGYWRRHGLWFAAVCLAAAADGISTWQFMNAGGIEDEMHPAIRIVSRWLGPFAGPLIAKFCQLAALLLLTVTFDRYARLLCAIVFLTYSCAAWFNTWGCYLYTPFFAKPLSF